MKICIKNLGNKFHKKKEDMEPTPILPKPKLIQPSAVKPVIVPHSEPIVHSDDDLKLVVTTPAIVTPKEIISIRKPEIFSPSDLNPPCELKLAIAKPSETLVNHHENGNRPTQANAGYPEASNDNTNDIVAPKRITKITHATLSSLVLGNFGINLSRLANSLLGRLILGKQRAGQASGDAHVWSRGDDSGSHDRSDAAREQSFIPLAPGSDRELECIGRRQH